MGMSVSNPDDLGRLGRLGRLERRDGQVLVTFTRRLAYPPSTVWRALTEAEHLAAWFPTTIEGGWVAGGALRFAFPNNEAPSFGGDMLAFEPQSLMELRWGDEILRFVLEPDGDRTVLTFTVAFDELGKVARDGAGWHACLDLLDFAIAGRVALWSSAHRWRQVNPLYVERFGPEASRIGPPEGWERVHGAADPTDTR
jgi:uncharacterized protein YndB with AHSA1/START domain